MEERVKLLAMIGAGALLGSAATVAVLKLLPRRVENECIREAAKSNGGISVLALFITVIIINVISGTIALLLFFFF